MTALLKKISGVVASIAAFSYPFIASASGGAAEEVTCDTATDPFCIKSSQVEGLAKGSLQGTVGKIITQFITLLGIVAVVIILYGGYQWMTASGDQAKVDKGKKILTQGIIGLVIIVLSYAIANFVINALSKAAA